jgi:hypothetical protein
MQVFPRYSAISASAEFHADELILYDNTAHRRGFRVVAQFIGGNLCKTAQTIPDWVTKVFGKELQATKRHEKSGRGR